MPGAFVLDNSVAISWCFPEERRATLAVLDSLATREALVPSIWPLELGNALAVAERGKRLTAGDLSGFLSFFSQLPIRVEPETPSRQLKQILSLAREHGLSTYDASYLDLAMRLALPLASLDKDLSRAARRAGVKEFRP